jgi:hypothetical protein
MTVLRRIAAWRRREPTPQRASGSGDLDATLPVTAPALAVQRPTVEPTERAYDLVLIAAVLRPSGSPHRSG